ncbi:MAG: glycosyl hydrolase [Bacteroidetes bacterium]|nr:MAG: glycosyl hydrolase [Bacteroidota bacterium]
MKKFSTLVLCLVLFASLALQAQKAPEKAKEDKKKPEAGTGTEEKDALSSAVLSGLRFRSIGPAVTSGRVIDFAVNPKNRAEYYVAAASGGVWKTVNGGTTFDPIFEGQSSYSIGCITLDPGNSNVVWVGSGENNSQRSVAYGDGVYKSSDGGKSWKNVGLKNSEHIGKIVVDPRNSDVVFVAAQGPVWSPGGDRGLYKTTDGGKTWKKVLEISENTGVTDVIMDPRNSNVLYAAAWQRRRHEWTLISGGPESALYKSTDGGETWNKSQSGLPSGDLGRIGLAISPVNPDVVYLILEATTDNSGFYRSVNRGESWEKRSGTSTSGNYYQEIFCDPVNVDRVYVMDTYAKVTDDGGATFKPLGEKSKHVDNHAIWVDPAYPNYYLVGCDGGIYDSYDKGKTWNYKPNLSITQFYKVTTDNSEPFYYVYGGTQDNFSLGGPSRTTNAAGIVNADWFVTQGGDGFESQVDPKEPNIVYAQAQYGALVRFDRKSGESVYIQPQTGKGEEPLRWNWDAPLMVSPHLNTRIYFAANKLFRSDDRGDTWKAISPDLTRQLDRNSLPVMGKVWSMDAVAKNQSTTIYGNITTVAEAPQKEGVIYVGTDDGLIQVTENGGSDWRKTESFPGVPERTFVNHIYASSHNENTLYASFNNHRMGDFKPYLLKSTDRGRSWTSITGNLPERGTVYCLAEDPVNANLLFAGTEFGVFVSIDGGQKWIQLKGGLPTIAVRDMEIQKRENDLVIATFGRGFYILDDISPLRTLNTEVLAKEAHVFPVKDALLFLPSRPLGVPGKGFQGESYFTAANPPIGAVFTYYIKESYKTRKEIRQEAEKKAIEKGEPVKYPSFDEMRAEDDEEAPYLVFTVKDASGNVVNRLRTAAGTGIQRTVWNFRYPTVTPVNLNPQVSDDPFSEPDQGYLALPGTYTVSVSKVINGVVSDLVAPVSFVVKPLNNTTLPATDRTQVTAFYKEVSELRRDLYQVLSVHEEMATKIKYIKKAIQVTPSAPLAMTSDARSTETQLIGIERRLTGDRSLARREFPVPTSVADRIETVVYSLSSYTGNPTQTQRDQIRIAREELAVISKEVKAIVTTIQAMEKQLDTYGAPYTPGRSGGQD